MVFFWCADKKFPARGSTRVLSCFSRRGTAAPYFACGCHAVLIRFMWPSSGPRLAAAFFVTAASHCPCVLLNPDRDIHAAPRLFCHTADARTHARTDATARVLGRRNFRPFRRTPLHVRKMMSKKKWDAVGLHWHRADGDLWTLSTHLFGRLAFVI